MKMFFKANDLGTNQNFNYEDMSQRVSKLQIENDIRTQSLNREFEILEQKLTDLSLSEANNMKDESRDFAKKTIKKMTNIFREIDAKFVEIDYLDESNKEIGLDDIQEQIKQIINQLKYFETHYYLN